MQGWWGGGACRHSGPARVRDKVGYACDTCMSILGGLNWAAGGSTSGLFFFVPFCFVWLDG